MVDRRAAEANKENLGEPATLRVLTQEEELRVLQERVQNFNLPSQTAEEEAAREENQALSSDEGTVPVQALAATATSRSVSPAVSAAPASAETAP